MDDDQEMERFGMENDYEGGQWIGGEFLYRNRKEKRLQTREDVLYGVFAASDSDSEAEGSFRRGRRGGISKKSDISKPVNFVSTGSMPSEEVDRPEESSKTEAPGVGLGFGLNQGTGLGFQSEAALSKKEKNRGGSEEDDEDTFLPTAFGRIIKEGARRREKERESAEMAAAKSEKKTRGGREAEFGGSVGEFERHTKGIGLKLLEKMGYKKGEGLGKNAQGIVAPIEAKLRPKNMGMGFNDFKEANAGLPPLPALEERDSKASATVSESRPRERLWSRHNRGRKKEYVTPEELLAKKQDTGPEVVQKVLDMRGAQVRVLKNLENLNEEDMAVEERVPMPELQHNVRLIVDLAEADIYKIDRELRQEKETMAVLVKEKERLRETEGRQKQQLGIMVEILGTIRKVREENLTGSLTLKSLASTFGDLKKRYKDDYKLCNLSCIACSFAVPLLIKVFQGWDPLLNPSKGLDLMPVWKTLLHGEEPIDYGTYDNSEANMNSPYTELVMEVIFPAVRISATNSWEPRDPEPLLGFLESWHELIPQPVLHNILDTIVMPKLATAVDSWDPRRETVPIHVWLHPWLPWLGQKMEPLYHPIRYKLGNVLHAWHASDASAFAMLSPWRTVFDPNNWEQLVVRYIVPKLISALQEFQINPANQKLDQFYWVMTWTSSIPIHHMVAILETGFFSKWLQVLYHWLCSNPNFEEVMQWYLGWKGLFPQELLANERIRYQLNVGLNMMTQAAEGAVVVQPGARENVSYLRITEQRQFEAQQQAAYAQQQSVGTANGVPESNLKEFLETYARDNDIKFLPKVGRMHDGLQIYGFGSISVCVDSVNRVIFAQSGERWSAVSMDELLGMHRARGMRGRG
ncbi:septin and tuftelin-interacting protein 1 homolog 1 [Nymphaea colorata]|nr:septin and tuftelin-interacting protein 1 homolog 1 [Nymphaea colorata]XP_031487476.1 septin and tuftelin-interacting protein 1 homolog 1 [Nymphaea colorata]